MRHLVADLERIPGVVAVTLGGSRATGAATEGSDWDFGLYYRGGVDTDAIRSLGWGGRVFEPGDWGREDLVASTANLAQAVLSVAQARRAAGTSPSRTPTATPAERFHPVRTIRARSVPDSGTEAARIVHRNAARSGRLFERRSFSG